MEILLKSMWKSIWKACEKNPSRMWKECEKVFELCLSWPSARIKFYTIDLQFCAIILRDFAHSVGDYTPIFHHEITILRDNPQVIHKLSTVGLTTEDTVEILQMDPRPTGELNWGLTLHTIHYSHYTHYAHYSRSLIHCIDQTLIVYSVDSTLTIACNSLILLDFYFSL